jgi:hypothetical protein
VSGGGSLRSFASTRASGGRRRLFDDGEALWQAVCEHELEGVVAKRRSGRYLPGRGGWIKTKNRDYWRYEMETRRRAHRQTRAPVRLTGEGAARRYQHVPVLYGGGCSLL